MPSFKNGWVPTRFLKPEEQTRRAQLRLKNLGVIDQSGKQVQVCRNKTVETLSAYYDLTQYNKLLDWDKKEDDNGEKVSIYKKKPKINYPFAKNLSSRVASKLVGQSVFPSFSIEDSPDDQEFIRAVIRESGIKSRILDPVKKALAVGSCFVRFKIAGGKYSFETFDSKYCYPEFNDGGDLEKVVVKYVFPAPGETDINGYPLYRWYKAEYGNESEIIYDTPEYNPEATEEPEFQVVDQFDHGLGFVQGEWLRTSESDVDGFSLVGDILSFIDELNYSLSQSSRAVAYNQDPQLVINGMTTDELGDLIRSVTKSWNLGREGKAEFLESGLEGVKTAGEMRDNVKQNIADFSRVALLDPEKIVGSAQSAKAMEVLHGPMVDLIDELRPVFEKQIKSLILKMAATLLWASQMGIDIPIALPPGFMPMSLDIVIKWPPIFKLTLEDIQKKVALAVSASSANIISRRTALKYVAEEFGVEDLDEEINEVNAQPQFNPFGGF